MSNYQYSEVLDALISAYDKAQEGAPEEVDVTQLFEDVAKPIHERIFTSERPEGNLGQSWNSVKGQLFERFAHYAILSMIRESSVKNLKLAYGNKTGEENSDTSRIAEQETARNSIEVDFGDQGKWSPDADLIVYSNYDDIRVEAIISCKTSLRERIAQTAFWRYKLASLEKTSHIKNILITLDSDSVFFGSRLNKSRAIALSELDAIFVLKPGFVEHPKLKSFDQFTEELKKWLKKQP